MRFDGKVAIVTGAASGIGQSIARAFGAEGAAVVVDYVGDSRQGAQDTVDMIVDAGGKAVAIQADVAKPDDVRALVAQTVESYGKLDIMVNNAGIEKDMPFLETPFELWQKIVAVDLGGVFLCSQEAARQMVKQGQGGRIINISSVHEELPKPGGVPYCAAKGGMKMMMRTMCVELAPHRITVNNIGPGAIDTPMDAPLKANPELYHELLSHIPMGRMGTPEEIGNCAVFLASDEAAYVTGATFFVDGGLMRYATSL
jgi:glucose 1-dehydrogenase